MLMIPLKEKGTKIKRCLMATGQIQQDLFKAKGEGGG